MACVTSVLESEAAREYRAFLCALIRLGMAMVASRPMMTMTTNNSTSVKPWQARRRKQPMRQSPE